MKAMLAEVRFNGNRLRPSLRLSSCRAALSQMYNGMTGKQVKCDSSDLVREGCEEHQFGAGMFESLMTWRHFATSVATTWA
jgi:hypothetical protein